MTTRLSIDINLNAEEANNLLKSIGKVLEINHEIGFHKVRFTADEVTTLINLQVALNPIKYE